MPKRRPKSTRERNRIGRFVAWYLQNQPAVVVSKFILRAAWLANDVGHTVLSYLDEPRPLEELRKRAKQPRPGYDIHHIVEKMPAYQDGFPKERVESFENRVLIPRYKHWEITAWYMTANDDFGGLSPREFLRGASWFDRMKIGLYVLQKHGVPKP